MPLPPHIAMPASRASAATRSASNGMLGSGGSASYSDENVTADRAPAAIASRSACSIRWFATPRIARSTDSEHVGDRGIAAETLDLVVARD